MLVPRYVRGQMVMVDHAPFDIQERLQKGCGCGCGWEGDRALILQMIPAQYGKGYCVIQKDREDQPGYIVFRSDRAFPGDEMTIDHRVITYLAMAHRNWKAKGGALGIVEQAEREYEEDRAKRENELSENLINEAVAYMKRGKSVTMNKKKDL